MTPAPHKQPAERPAAGPGAGSAPRGLWASPHNIWLLPWKQVVVIGRSVASGVGGWGVGTLGFHEGGKSDFCAFLGFL